MLNSENEQSNVRKTVHFKYPDNRWNKAIRMTRNSFQETKIGSRSAIDFLEPVVFERISHFVLVFLMLALRMFIVNGWFNL